jgi:type III secretion protein R
MKLSSPESLLLASVVVALVPLLIAVGTCYLKFSIVLTLLKSGFGTQQAPSSSMVMALSLVMSLVVMQPVLEGTAQRIKDVRVGTLAVQPVSALISDVTSVLGPWRSFLEKHCGARERMVFREIVGRSEAAAVVSPQSERLSILLAGFVLSEIKRAFVAGFFLLIPFFVIDLIVSNILVGMGLTMLSPVVVSLPLKILLFISTDGWLLLADGLVRSYG